MKGLPGKVVAVTGGETGIGRAIAAAPMGALVEPDELAGLVAFAISDEAPHMTGTILKVDAGRTSA